MTSRLPIIGAAALCCAALLLSACHRQASDTGAADAKKTDAVLLLSPEDISTVGSGALSGGPVISGSVQPERRADLRAEVAAVVLQVVKENGEAVRAGDLLVRLDDTAIRDSLTSAEAAERAAAQALDQAERQVQRLKTLQAQGMTSQQALDDAEVRRNSAQSELVGAKARVVSARQQLHRTEVRAPFDGVASERKVSAGDTAQIGKELIKVIDPRSMRFEGLVSADRMAEVQLGLPVRFRVNGYPQTEFTGKVRRIDAAANATTRQVEVLVAFDDPAQAPRVAGLFAEGRIAGGGAAVVSLPDAAIQRGNGQAWVWKVNGQQIAKAVVALGARDERSGEFPVQSGLTVGERILRHPTDTLVDGQKIQFAGPGAASAAAGR